MRGMTATLQGLEVVQFHAVATPWKMAF